MLESGNFIKVGRIGGGSIWYLVLSHFDWSIRSTYFYAWHHKWKSRVYLRDKSTWYQVRSTSIFDKNFPKNVFWISKSTSKSYITFLRFWNLPKKNCFRFGDDFRPILPDCSCLSCRKYSRAYIHHLVTVQELLGPLLLMM